MEGRPVSQSQAIMTELILPIHTNAINTVFGGAILSWVDICAAISARRHSLRDVVTVSVDELHFIRPAYLGWILNLKSSVNYVGKTSMEVGIRVEAEDPETGTFHHVSSAYFTFVAIGKRGSPVEIPPLVLETDIQRRRHKEAQIRRTARLEKRKTIEKGRLKK